MKITVLLIIFKLIVVFLHDTRVCVRTCVCVPACLYVHYIHIILNVTEVYIQVPQVYVCTPEIIKMSFIVNKRCYSRLYQNIENKRGQRTFVRTLIIYKYYIIKCMYFNYLNEFYKSLNKFENII